MPNSRPEIQNIPTTRRTVGWDNYPLITPLERTRIRRCCQYVSMVKSLQTYTLFVTPISSTRINRSLGMILENAGTTSSEYFSLPDEDWKTKLKASQICAAAEEYMKLKLTADNQGDTVVRVKLVIDGLEVVRA